MHPRRLRLLPLLCLLFPLFTAACDRANRPHDELRTARAAMKEGSNPTIVTGDQAIELLDERRRELLRLLQEQSGVPVEIVMEARTRTVLSISAKVPTRGETLEARSVGFLEVYQELIEPFVASTEYVLADQDPSCYEGTTVFDRFIKDTPVVGSRITIHFDDSQAIESVTNGVAPVPSEIVEIDPMSIEGARPLEELLPRGYEGTPTRTPVFFPSPDLRGLVQAELIGWSELGPRKNQTTPVAAIAIGNIAITGKLKVVTPVSQAPITTFEPKYYDQDGLPLPEFISYRDIGGVDVNHFSWEQNPLEMAYRFLEEHPALMRTGAARCQYVPRGMDEHPDVPGVYFIRLGQKYGPLPVFGSELVVMQEGVGKVMSIAGRTLPKIEAATAPAIQVLDALDSAARTLEEGAAQEPVYEEAVRDALSRPSKVALGVLPAHKQDPAYGTEERLVYEVQRGPYVLYVDALTADPIGSRSLIATANIVSDAMGSNELGWPFVIDEIDGIPTGLITTRNSDNVPTRPGGNTGASLFGISAFYAGEGWTGANDRGSDFVANTNVSMIFTSCQNAFFDGVITGQTFYCLGAAANDVIGHEVTHGVVAASSKLWFSDQSGALNEAYADVMGNLAFPDATPGGWVIAELTTGGAWRDMANPTAFNGDPGHISGFRFRDTTCNLLPWSCDSGFVHANAGIVNRAHVMLTDGIPAPGGGVPLTTGIGRAKMKKLAFFTMTQRLFPDARLHDAAVATRDICEMFVARGVSVGATPFTIADCDQVTASFNQVGLNGQLDSGWQEPTLGFAGTRVFNGSGETTPGGCPVSNVVADLSTISGNRSIDLDPTTVLPTSTTWFFGSQSIALRVSPSAPPLPLGTTSMFHIVDWRNAFGFEPRYATRVDFPATCAPPVNQVTRISTSTFTHNNLFGGTGTNFIGSVASSWGPGCILRDTNVELLNSAGFVTAGPAHSVQDRVTHWFFNIPVNYDQNATIVSPPPGGPSGNLFAGVTWNYHIGRGPIRIRLRYTIDQVGGAVCTP